MAGLADSGLHDYELVKLSADYTRGEVSLEMTRTKPRGEGSYIVSSDIEESQDGIKLAEIQLNSGDEIHIGYK